MYEKEVVDQEAKIEKMKAENRDEYDIKKQASCINKIAGTKLHAVSIQKLYF